MKKFHISLGLKNIFSGGLGVPPNEKILLLTQKHIPKTIKIKVSANDLGSESAPCELWVGVSCLCPILAC